MTNSTAKKVLIIGGGASGCLAAIAAARAGARVTLLERNERIGRKILITGKGRCNITNFCGLQELIQAVPSNGRFLYSAFSSFSPQDMIDFLQSEGLQTKVERGNRVFPQSDKAMDVVDTLASCMKKLHVIQLQGRADALLFEKETSSVLGITCDNGRKLFADSVILCTGGLSYPQTGSTGDGYRLSQQAGHSIVPPVPSLVPMTSDAGWCKSLQGLSLKNISIRLLREDGKCIYEDFGELLFTHFGISGPVVLSASAHLPKKSAQRYSVSIDLKPALSEQQLDQRLQRDFAKYSNRDFINALSDLLPRKLIPVIVQRSGIDGQTKIHQMTREMRRQLVSLIKNFSVPITGVRPIEEAIITSGGVNVREVNPKTMESKLIRGLFFAGELLDIDAYTGGFNLQIAWSTGVLAGTHAAKQVGQQVYNEI